MRTVPRRAAFLGFFLGVLLLGATARAQALPVDLSWDAPAECPTHDDVTAELSRIIRVTPGRTVTAVRAQAKIEHSADGRYRLHLRTQREDSPTSGGDTDLDAPSCAALERGVTLVLALALGDGVDVIDDKPEPPPPVPPPPPPLPPPAAPKPKPPPPHVEARPSLRAYPWLAVAAASGVIAKPALGAQIGFALGQNYWETALRLQGFPRGSAHTGNIDSAYSAWYAALGACLREPLGAGALAACANFDLGVVHGSATGSDHDSSATAPYYAVGPSAVATVPLHHRLQLRLEVGLSIAIDPPRFAIRGLQDVHVVSRYVPSASLGLTF